MSQSTQPISPELWTFPEPDAAPAHRPSTADPSERSRSLSPVAAGLRARQDGSKRLLGAIVSLAIVAVLLITQLGLSIATSEGAYETANLKLEERDLLRVERVLSQNVEKLASPQNLSAEAGGLGMVLNSSPAYLRLSDTTILGDLAMKTHEPTENSVPNDLLTELPAINAAELQTPKPVTAQAPVAPAKPVVWEGQLPAPVTR